MTAANVLPDLETLTDPEYAELLRQSLNGVEIISIKKEAKTELPPNQSAEPKALAAALAQIYLEQTLEPVSPTAGEMALAAAFNLLFDFHLNRKVQQSVTQPNATEAAINAGIDLYGIAKAMPQAIDPWLQELDDRISSRFKSAAKAGASSATI